MTLKIFNRAVVIGAIVWLLFMAPFGFLALMQLMFPAFATGDIDMEARNRDLMLIALVALCLSILISGVAARASANRIFGSEMIQSTAGSRSRFGFYVASGALVTLLGTLPLWWWGFSFTEPISFLPVLGVLGLTGAVGGALAFLLARRSVKLSAPRVDH